MAEPSDVKNLVAAFVKLGLADESAAFICRTLSAHADDPNAWLEMAAEMRRQGRYEAATRAYEFAERRFPMLARLQYNRGVLLHEAGMLEEALAAFTQAVRLKPDYANALESQGQTLELLGRFVQAEPVYRTLLQLQPQRATAWNNLGNCAKRLDRRAEARQCYEKAIELDPDYVFALVNLAGLLDEDKDRDGALALLRRALALDPTDEMATKLLRNIEANVPARRMLPPAWDAPRTLHGRTHAASLQAYIEQKRANSRIVPELLKRSRTLTDSTGFMAWSPDRLKADPMGDPGPHVLRLPPPTPTAPRLFISYAWTQVHQTPLNRGYHNDMFTYAIAGDLFNRGYQIVFDRDPRNLDKGLSEIDVLRRLYDCNYFVPIVTERYIEKIAPDTSTRNMGGAEWDLACQLADTGFLVFAGIWLSGDTLPPRLSAANTVDARAGRNLSPELRARFPQAAPGAYGIPWLPAPQRPPEPADWPVFDAG
jgi:tetratricopeptide (TPR) repeat protein